MPGNPRQLRKIEPFGRLRNPFAPQFWQMLNIMGEAVARWSENEQENQRLLSQLEFFEPGGAVPELNIPCLVDSNVDVPGSEYRWAYTVTRARCTEVGDDPPTWVRIDDPEESDIFVAYNYAEVNNTMLFPAMAMYGGEINPPPADPGDIAIIEPIPLADNSFVRIHRVSCQLADEMTQDRYWFEAKNDLSVICNESP